eukprot:jgi/Galph1/5505/GphlegSOOS_G4198.1
MERREVLVLYKKLLRALQHYPSIKKQQLLSLVKQDFRDNKHIHGEEQIRKVSLAKMELKRLEVFKTTRDEQNPHKPRASNDWWIQL